MGFWPFSSHCQDVIEIDHLSNGDLKVTYVPGQGSRNVPARDLPQYIVDDLFEDCEDEDGLEGDAWSVWFTATDVRSGDGHRHNSRAHSHVGSDISPWLSGVRGNRRRRPSGGLRSITESSRKRKPYTGWHDGWGVAGPSHYRGRNPGYSERSKRSAW